MRTTFKVTRDSEKFIESLQRSGKRFRAFSNKIVETIAGRCAEDVVKVVKFQSFPNVRLSEAWRQRKEREGYDVRTLIRTRAYVESIKAKKVEEGVWGVVCSDMDLMKRLEVGTRVSPPRPHWGPTMRHYRENFNELFAKEAVRRIFR